MNCLVGTVVAFIALTEAKNAPPRVQVYEIRRNTLYDDSSSLEGIYRPKHRPSQLKQLLSGNRDKIHLSDQDDTMKILTNLLQTLQVQESKYNALDKRQLDSDEKPPKKHLSFARVLRSGNNAKVKPRSDLRTNAPIHYYAYEGGRFRRSGKNEPKGTSSDSSDSDSD